MTTVSQVGVHVEERGVFSKGEPRRSICIVRKSKAERKQDRKNGRKKERKKERGREAEAVNGSLVLGLGLG